MLKLKALKDTKGNNAKVEYVKQNKGDLEFDYCLRFLLDDG